MVKSEQPENEEPFVILLKGSTKPCSDWEPNHWQVNVHFKNFDLRSLSVNSVNGALNAHELTPPPAF